MAELVHLALLLVLLAVPACKGGRILCRRQHHQQAGSPCTLLLLT
jgi:hypothetical protein